MAPSARLVKMVEKGVTVQGKLPPEVVRRIVRANFPRLRACYQAVVKKAPDATGLFSVDFVITEKGETIAVKESKSTLADKGALGCLTKIFQTLSWPEPEAGKVGVRYEIDFSNEVE